MIKSDGRNDRHSNRRYNTPAGTFVEKIAISNWVEGSQKRQAQEKKQPPWEGRYGDLMTEVYNQIFNGTDEDEIIRSIMSNPNFRNLTTKNIKGAILQVKKDVKQYGRKKADEPR